MAQRRWDRIQELFEQARALSENDRGRLLDERCADDPDLRREVESLLEYVSSEFLPDRKPIRQLISDDTDFEAVDSIGEYKVLELLGQGGMGLVYLAEQEQPVQRQVALKVIKWGLDTREFVARFETERQALALMNHPNIARVYDAGSTDAGRPYLVMEYVQGVPLLDHCDRQRLGVRERLALFNEICEGVQHAHHKGVIHRDIKPSNILVAMQDGKAVPKIIDFGVAKATDRRLTEHAVHTQLGLLIGTPEYMSPEQAEMTRQGVDTRTDIYSLGVVLYELLVGVSPFNTPELRGAGYDELRRIIREQEPPTPSAKLNGLGEDATEIARSRSSDRSSLAHALRLDLDWVTMKALEKDRARRYGSPAEFAADVKRYLANMPVQAGPPSTIYRARKFARRHRVGVAVSAAAIAGLIVFGVMTAIQTHRIVRAQERTERVLEFLAGLYRVSEPSESRGRTISAREMLDEGAARIQWQLSDEPELQARMMHELGIVYTNLGLADEAEPLLSKALLVRRNLLGDDDPETLRTSNAVAVLHELNGRYEEAERLFVATLESRRQVLGEKHADTLISMSNLAGLYRLQGRYDQAESLSTRTLEIRRRVFGDDHADTLDSMSEMADLYLAEARYGEAERLYLETIETRERRLGQDHPDTLESKTGLAHVYEAQGLYHRAEPLHVETLETKRRVLGPKHPDTLASMISLALVYWRQDRHIEAEALYKDVLRVQRRVLGHDNPATLVTMNNLALSYHTRNRLDEAERLYRETLEIKQRVIGSENPGTLRAANNLAQVYVDQGRYSEAEPLLVDTLATLERKLPEHPLTLGSKFNLAELYVKLGRHDEAMRLHLATLDSRRRVLGGEHPDIVDSLYGLACLSALRAEERQAIEYLQEAVRIGYADAERMRGDPDLAALRGNPGFEKVLTEAEARAGSIQ